VELYNQQKLHQVFEKTQLLTKTYANNLVLWNLMGASAAQIGQLDEAVIAFQNAITINTENSPAYNNIGNVFKKQGRLEEALEAFSKALSIKPDFAEALNNLGNTLKDQGKLGEAAEAFTKAIKIKPEYADAHHNLSTIKKYTIGDEQFLQVQELYKGEDLSEDDRCHLSFALAKMHEDIGELDQAFKYLSEGNSLCKKLLNYSIEQDEKLFKKLKERQPKLAVRKIEIKEVSFGPKPIFILGMPRSGTTLVEQIISSHSEVTGAGELNHVYQFGANLALNQKDFTQVAVSEFRDRCLAELSKVSNGKSIVTDKMPHNFLFIPLICAAFPEAKIIHVQRNAAATCWSNYKKYFASDFLGYCHDLKDVVDYYNLYRDLMKFWQSNYDKKIYNLNYEKLTTEQEKETRKLIKHLDLNWEKACLSPHKNTRSVGTASQLQVRQKVYKGSSKAWRKYEPYLNGAFDSLLSS
ncbi:sulfotransferase, partial [Paracoccaceae bacterium]|nr:sulfotransferase [Paracoccaceae bacterium]